jgi:hypothetical protein
VLHQAIADRLGLNPTDHKCLGLLVDASGLRQQLERDLLALVYRTH